MKAVVYARVSTAEQVENYSLDTQIKGCLQYSEQNELEVVRIFREEGASAKTAARPELTRLIDYCTSNKGIDFLIVYRVDRLARNVLHHQMIRMTLEKVGVSVRAVQESFDDSASGKLIENLMASMAQFDNDLRSARATEGMKEGLSRGRWMWQAPIGYVRQPKGNFGPSLVPDPETAHLVKRAFEMYASGAMGKNEVLESVTQLGLLRHGKSLSPQAFGAMLANPIYKGLIVSKSFRFEGPGDFEPLISEDLYDAVLRVSTHKSKNEPKKHLDHPDFPLRRIVRCGACNTPLTGSWSTGRSARYPYYRCRRKGCKGVNVRKERLESEFELLLGDLETRKELFDLMAEVIRDTFQEHRSIHEADKTRIERRRAELEDQEQRLLEAYLYEKIIDEETYLKERTRIKDQLSNLKDEISAPLPIPERLDQAVAFATGMLSDLGGYWNRLKAEARPGFLKVVVPEGIAYLDGEFRTAESPLFFLRNHAAKRPGESWAVPTGFEPAFPA